MTLILFAVLTLVLLAFAVMLFRSTFSATSIVKRIILTTFAALGAFGFAYLTYVVLWPFEQWHTGLLSALPGGHMGWVTIGVAAASGLIALFLLSVAYNTWAGKYIGFGRVRRLSHAGVALVASIATAAFTWLYVPGGNIKLPDWRGESTAKVQPAVLTKEAPERNIKVSSPAHNATLAKERDRVESLESEVARLKSELSSTRGTVEESDRKLSQIEVERDTARASISSLEDEVSKLKARLSRSGKTDEAALRDTIKQKEQRISVLELESDQLQRARDALRQKLTAQESTNSDTYEQRIASLEQQVKSLSYSRNSLRDELARKDPEIKAFQERIALLQSHIEPVAGTRDALRAEVASLKHRLTNDGEDVAELRRRLDKERRATAILDDENSSLISRTKTLTRKNESLRSDLRQREQQELSRLRTVLRSQWSLRNLAYERVHGESNRSYFDEPNTRDEAIERYDRTNTETRDLLQRLFPEGQMAPQLAQLREDFDRGLSTDDYDVQVLPSDELISGQKGKYYLVDLKNADAGEKFFFPAGKYTLGRSNPAFARALSGFVNGVLDKLEGNTRYSIFVRGSADNVPFRGRMERDNKFEEVRYLREVSSDTFGPATGRHTFTRTIRNNDLPNLRAAFLQRVVSTAYPVKPPVVLEGEVTGKRDAEDRNVSLVLFVDW